MDINQIQGGRRRSREMREIADLRLTDRPRNGEDIRNGLHMKSEDRVSENTQRMPLTRLTKKLLKMGKIKKDKTVK